MKSPLVLLLDDDPVDRRLVKTKLRAHGWTGPIKSFEDGREAFAYLSEHASHFVEGPCIIMLDISMPRMTGFEFLSVLRSNPDLVGSVVFMLSSSDDPRDIAEARSYSVAGYLSKELLGPDYEKLAALLHSYRAATLC